MSNLETITGLLTLLNNVELDSLSKTIDSLRTGNQKESLPDDIELFYKIVNASYETMYPPLSVLSKKNVKLYKRICKTNKFINEYLDKILAAHNNKTGDAFTPDRKSKIKLYKFYITIMEKWFIEIGVPNSLKTLLQNDTKFPSLLDKQFPGYKDAGLLVPIVIKNTRAPLRDMTANARNGRYVELHTD